MLERWRDFRERQRAALAESNRRGGLAQRVDESPPETSFVAPESRPDDLLGDLLPREDPAPATSTAAATTASAEHQPPPNEPRGRGRGTHRDFGTAGRPLNRQSPLYVGFVGAFGVLAAYGLWKLVASLGAVLTLITVAFFLTLALDPLVEVLVRRGLRRGPSVTIVFVLLVLVFTLLGFLVVPPVSQQATDLVNNAPSFLQQVISNPTVQSLDQHYQVISRLQTELNQRLTDSTFLSQVAGGLFGAGRLIASGIFSTLTVLVLTLYFLVSLPSLKQAAYAVVPASRRPRVISLSEEIMRRVGSYAIGQVAVASVNAVCSWIMMSIVGIPYAAVLAVLVGFLGLVPMVGATLGALLVALVAVFDDPTKAVIALVYFVVYQQLENYVVAPRVMRRTVSVPGAVTVVAALAGGTVLGFVGALIAIPAAAGLLLLYDEVLVPRQRRH